MAILRRVVPNSAFKLGLALYGALGLILGVLAAIASIVMTLLAAAGSETIPGTTAARLGLGFAAIVVLPSIYGAAGGVIAAISAAIYNLASRWVGGLEVDIN